jgi:hypothetical protein
VCHYAIVTSPDTVKVNKKSPGAIGVFVLVPGETVIAGAADPGTLK